MNITARYYSKILYGWTQIRHIPILTLNICLKASRIKIVEILRTELNRKVAAGSECMSYASREECVCVRGWHLQSFLKEHESLRDEYVSLCVRLNFSVWISITLHNTTHTTWFVLMGLHEHHYYFSGIQHTAVYWYTLVHGCTTLSLSLTLLKSIIRFGCFRIYFCIWVLYHTRSCTHARKHGHCCLAGWW